MRVAQTCSYHSCMNITLLRKRGDQSLTGKSSSLGLMRMKRNPFDASFSSVLKSLLFLCCYLMD